MFLVSSLLKVSWAELREDCENNSYNCNNRRPKPTRGTESNLTKAIDWRKKMLCESILLVGRTDVVYEEFHEDGVRHLCRVPKHADADCQSMVLSVAVFLSLENAYKSCYSCRDE